MTAVAEIYEEKPFLISGAENVLVTDLGAKEVETKVKTKEEATVELERELGKTDLNVKSEKGGEVEGGNVKGLDGGEKTGEEAERGPAVVQEGEQPQGAARWQSLIISESSLTSVTLIFNIRIIIKIIFNIS